MRGHLNRYVILPGLLSLGIGRSVSAQDAVRVSTATDSFRGVVRDRISWTGIPEVRVYLTKDSVEIWSSVAPWHRTITDDRGEFVLPDVPSGSYVVNLDLRGYPTQRDPVEVGNTSERDRVWELRFGGPCLGFCFPSPSEVAYNRSHRAEWGCQTSYPQSIEAVRDTWVGSLAEREPAAWDSLLVAHRVPRDSAGIARGLRHVKDREACRRAGEAYDAAVAATTPDFLVFRIKDLLIATEPWGGRATVVLNRDYES